MTSDRGGWPALGYRLRVDPTEAARVRQVFELVAGGSACTTAKVRRILHHEDYRQPGELRIVAPALWALAHRQLAKRRPR